MKLLHLTLAISPKNFSLSAIECSKLSLYGVRSLLQSGLDSYEENCIAHKFLTLISDEAETLYKDC